MATTNGNDYGPLTERRHNGLHCTYKLKEKGKIAHREAKTFDRRQAANAWIVRREDELRKPGGLRRQDDPALRFVIDRYIEESKREIGRTKSQVLRTIKTYNIADMRCSEIASPDVVSFAKALPVSPATVQNYLARRSAVIMHRIWVDGTEFHWTREVTAA
jgi:hypothetical protein